MTETSTSKLTAAGRDERRALCIMGPTASGKTGLAVALVKRLPFEIISVDSALIYRGMDIGTAKPDAATLAEAPHHLIDILDPSERYSAARFREDALEQMEQIHARGRLPLLVGGTSLYFRALEQGLSDLPAADETVRRRLEQQAAEQGWMALHQRLREVDPESAERIHPNDPQRLQRALEVYEITGEPLSAWLARGRKQRGGFSFCKLALVPPDRERLRALIAERFHLMLEQGLVEEVKALYQRGDLTPDLPAIRAVGYRQVWSYLAGELEYDEMVERAITATRQYAKRQMTWLRSEPALRWLDPARPDLVDEVLAWWQAGCPLSDSDQ